MTVTYCYFFILRKNTVRENMAVSDKRDNHGHLVLSLTTPFTGSLLHDTFLTIAPSLLRKPPKTRRSDGGLNNSVTKAASTKSTSLQRRSSPIRPTKNATG